jgi:general secretion pathway protein A
MNNMILDFYGLSHLPFSKEIPEKDVFKTHAHSEALGMMELGLTSEDIMLLSGEIGSGKSVVLRSFMALLDPNSHMPVYLRGAYMGQTDLIKSILFELKIEPPHFANNARLVFYNSISELSRKPVVIIDDAQELKDSALLGLKSLVNFDCDSKNKIIFILAGQPELLVRIRMSHFYSLRQRIRLSLDMKKMNLEETCQYIDHHMKICDHSNSLFSDSAKAEIFRRSNGNPRLVNTFCYNAIVHGAGKKYEIIDSSNLVFSDILVV